MISCVQGILPFTEKTQTVILVSLLIFSITFFFSFFPRDSENSPDVVRYQIYSVRIPKGRVELYKKKRYFRPYHNPVTSSGYQKKLNNKVLWAMGHRPCKNNKKGRLCSRTHTAGKKASSVQMPKTIVFLPFDLCESNFADLPGQGARPTERNWEGQNYRGLCCWYLSPVTITSIFLTCPCWKWQFQSSPRLGHLRGRRHVWGGGLLDGPQGTEAIS